MIAPIIRAANMNIKNGSESAKAGASVLNGSRLNVTQCLFATDSKIIMIAIGARKIKFINLRKILSPYNIRFIDYALSRSRSSLPVLKNGTHFSSTLT